jgi:histidyl-tRNA synthetase
MAFHLWPMVSGFFADNQCQPIWRDDDSAEGRFRDPAGLSIDCFEKTYPKLDIVSYLLVMYHYRSPLNIFKNPINIPGNIP